LINKFQKLLRNYKMKDPFNGHIAHPILVNEAEVGQYLSTDSKALIRDFGNAIGLNFIEADTKVYMHGFSYNVQGFSTNLKASEQMRDGLVVGTDFSASEVSL